MSASDHTPTIEIIEPRINELAGLRDVRPPPSLVARVMTKVSEPRVPSLWQWLRRPFQIEIRVSPLLLIALAMVVAAGFVFIGATLR